MPALPRAVVTEQAGLDAQQAALVAGLAARWRLTAGVDQDATQPDTVAEYPEVCGEVRWGQQLAGVGFDLSRAPEDLVVEYLTESWSARASAAQRTDREQRG